MPFMRDLSTSLRAGAIKVQEVLAAMSYIDNSTPTNVAQWDGYERWRVVACDMGHKLFSLDIIDGDSRGDAAIGMMIFPMAGRASAPKYTNGSTAWCGYFVQAVLRHAGWNTALDCGSWYRARVYGTYGSDLGAPQYVVWQGKVELIRDVHKRLSDLRACRTASKYVMVQPGDIVVHCPPDGQKHGHVMMAILPRINGQITVIEGNHSKTIGPDCTKRDGVGVRILDIPSDYIDHIIRPSSMDFKPGLRYFKTRKEAEQWLLNAS